MAETARTEVIPVWAPQPGPQTAYLACPIFEVCYGGARGGGKTDGALGDWAKHAQEFGEHASGVFFRRELVQLDDVIGRSKVLFTPLGARYQDQKKTWIFPNGAVLRFRPLERDGDAEKYQGHSYTRVYIEELTNYPDPGPVMKLKATLRSGVGVPVGFRATCNPGGPGHHWVKARYIDPAPGGYEVLADEDGLERVFIPAKLQDNSLLLDNDPTYVSRLKQAGSEALVRAWLNGDWDVIEGAYFDCWRADQHVIEPFAIPDWWTRFRSLDWGSAAPFSVGWWAVSDGTQVNGRSYPPGAMIRYREWYGAKKPNVGLKMTAEQVARGIVQRTPKGEKIMYTVADTSVFDWDGGPSIGERMHGAGLKRLRKSDKRREPGWDQMRQRLLGADRPMLYVFKTCTDFIRTIPALQHDEIKVEDVDTNGEDHVADETRYACMSRPWMKGKPPPPHDPLKPVPITLKRPVRG